MIINTESGVQIRGDLIEKATLRNGIYPIPVTLEAVITADDSLAAQLKQGKTLQIGSGDKLRIIHVTAPKANTVQGIRQQSVVSLVAVLDAVHPMAFARNQATMLENSTLASIYRAVGCKLAQVDGDIPAARFYVPVGKVATEMVARILQEECACVGWRAGKLFFKRLPDLYKSKPVLSLAPSGADMEQNGFLQRHEVPSFHAISPDGSFVFGDRSKARNTVFVPGRKTERQLRNMSRCIIERRTQLVYYQQNICGGDLVEYVGEKRPLIVITAAHEIDHGNSCTRLWLGSLEGG